MHHPNSHNYRDWPESSRTPHPHRTPGLVETRTRLGCLLLYVCGCGWLVIIGFVQTLKMIFG
jgi:hypothetical protein